MVARILGAAPGPEVLDVGIGTGIAARQFQNAGARVLGVEVDARMAEFARERGFDVEVARFEDWEPAGRAFDAVVAGQTWHWVDPAAGAAKAAQALRPRGRIALFWNVFRPPPEIGEGFSAVYRQVLPELPRNPWARSAMETYPAVFDKVSTGIDETTAFGAVEQWQFGWEHRYARDEWLDQVPTHGDSSQLPPGVLAELLNRVAAVIDAAGGEFTMGYTAVVVTAQRHG